MNNFFKFYDTGVILGKFMPPHKGHEYMIRFAKNYVKSLYVIIDKTDKDVISGELRKSWLDEEIQGINVMYLETNTPQTPSEHPDFWKFWKITILNAIEHYQNKNNQEIKKPHVLIAAMDYGWDLAKALDCEFIQLDIARESFSISATELREDVYKNWDFLIDSARPFFMKKICFLGPESTGKSVCAQRLAKHLNTIYVPEYAKAVIKSQHGKFIESNVSQVIQAQINTEKSLAKFTNKVLVCDSDAITTKIYAQALFEKFNPFPSELEEIIKTTHYDLTFLFKPDNNTPFIYDIHRNVLSEDAQQERNKFFKLFEEELIKYKRNYVVIDGTYEERLERALSYTNKLLGEK